MLDFYSPSASTSPLGDEKGIPYFKCLKSNSRLLLVYFSKYSISTLTKSSWSPPLIPPLFKTSSANLLLYFEKCPDSDPFIISTFSSSNYHLKFDCYKRLLGFFLFLPMPAYYYRHITHNNHCHF